MYNFAIELYNIGAKAASLFSKKVNTMLKGQQDCFEVLRTKIDPNRRYLWFHAASLRPNLPPATDTRFDRVKWE